MAPDRGRSSLDDVDGDGDARSTSSDHDADDTTLEHETSRSIAQEPIGQEPDPEFLAKMSEQPQFTLRALLAGIIIGILIAFSNTYFGLQTGWISGMAMPSALIGFAYFKGLRTLTTQLGGPLKRLGLGEGFSEVENVLVQTVAGSVGTMPLGCGFVGVVPALEFLLKPSETPDNTWSILPQTPVSVAESKALTGIHLPMGKLVLWALGVCFFGVMFAVPLRKEVIIREKLKFPSGTATALMIGVLHGGEKTGAEGNIEEHTARRRGRTNNENDEESRGLLSDVPPTIHEQHGEPLGRRDSQTEAAKKDWRKQIRLLTTSFGISGLYTFVSYFLPQLHSIPFLGLYMSRTWVWNLNPSPAYVGQGIIMGPATTIHMFLGALLGWAVLSPLAKHKGWAPGPVNDWNTGSKGWIVWVSLAIMLADAIVSLGWLILRPSIWYSRTYGPDIIRGLKNKGIKRYLSDAAGPVMRGYSPVNLDEPEGSFHKSRSQNATDEEEYDAPPEHRIGTKTASVGMVLALVFCVVAVQVSFQGIISIGLTILSIVLALLLSIMGVRALGETDLNPVSGISKLTQLIFAAVVPAGTKNAVTINLIAGAVSEAGALQAGDLLQDLKCGHLLGASPKAQFWGQLIGSGVGAVVSACVYRLYTSVYEIPGGLFQVPTGFVWIFTARLVTGQGLPPKTAEFAAGAAVVWALLTALRIYGNSKKASWVPYIPGGIAVAVGMYNTPSFTLARTVGGLMAWYWTSLKRREETPLIVLASGLILGEGLLSIVNLCLASARVPHA